MGSLVASGAATVFKGRRVLLTGDTGFKGSWLGLWLHGLEANVVGFAQPPERSFDHFRVLDLDRLIHHVDGDIRDSTALQRVFNGFRPEFVFHLAAQSLVRHSYKEPKLTFDTNVGGSVNILENCRRCVSVRSVIYVTSDKCYRNKESPHGYREDDELGGRDCYSASKAAAEMAFAAYCESFFRHEKRLGAASVRAGNAIGGGDWTPDRILPDCVRALQSGRPILLRSPDSTRPWQHVLDPLSGYLMLAAKLRENPTDFSGSWNFGPHGNAKHTVRELATKVVACWGKGKVTVKREKDQRHEAGLLHLNSSKAQRLLGWRPSWHFSRAVSEAVRWYKETHSGCQARSLSKQQIVAYMETEQ